ncbi:MAG: hypothetical protein CL959_01825 [Euryarchaeota archaeon]|nr:hypothetical protein [Euryarchaeota archaeon]|tara:strand:+ start:1440 stop:1835 length:396 start_codon:yes stop_codon:yes gene_type:complete
MPYGKILADEIENSGGSSLDLTVLVTDDATTSAKGYMSAADKAKLDGIEAGAQANVAGFSGDYDDLTNKPTLFQAGDLNPVLYATTGDLPAASGVHGAVAHVHAEGALFYAHGGNWVKLQNASLSSLPTLP